MSAVGLLVAKAPVAGQAKTRLGAAIGMDAAAELATAALLDTIDALGAAFGPTRCYLALAGDLDDSVAGEEIAAALAGWVVLPQRGDGFGERLLHAHTDVAERAGAPVVQVGMDTPQLEATDLVGIADHLGTAASAVLGPAYDGGWWVLGVAHPSLVGGLSEVPMSTSDTGERTRAALEGAGAQVSTTRTLRDVDTIDDVAEVAAAAPDTRFARTWARLCPEAGREDDHDR